MVISGGKKMARSYFKQEHDLGMYYVLLCTEGWAIY